MIANQILSMLNGSDSKNPVPLLVLRDKTGMAIGPLIELVEEMYAVRSINKCNVTKDGVTQIMVWPTGVPERVSFKKFSINPPAPLRMDNTSPGLNAPVIKEPEKLSMEHKSKTRIILETIAEKGMVSGKELIRTARASSIKPFIKSYVDRGLIGITGANGDKTYSLAPGVTPETLLDGVRRDVPANSGEIDGIKLKVSPTPEANAGAESGGNTPDLVPASDHTETGNPVAEQKQDVAPDHVPDVKKMIIPAPIPVARSRFRLALTSDGTLMLFGLSADPIELDQDQTELLVNFVSSGVAAHG